LLVCATGLGYANPSRVENSLVSDRELARIFTHFHGSGDIMDTAVETHFEARFCSLSGDGRAMTFPCDAKGKVNLDGLSDRARNNYLYARALMGREFSAPIVMACREAAVPAGLGNQLGDYAGLALVAREPAHT
jgi:hypothetical protein